MTLTRSPTRAHVRDATRALTDLVGGISGPSISLSAPDFGGSTYYEGVDDNDITVTINNATDGASWDLTISSSGGGTPVTASGTVSGSTVNAGAQNLTGLNAGTLTFSYEEASVEVATKTGTLAAQAAPDAPTITDVVWSSEAATVTITPGTANGSAITDHIWEYNADGGGWTEFAAGVSTATSETTPALTKGASVDFRVRSVNGIGTGLNSATYSSSVPATVPGQIQSLVLTPGVDQLDVDYADPSDDGGASITERIVQYRINGSGDDYQVFSTNSTPAGGETITGLTGGTLYDVQVFARNSVGDGAPATGSDTPTSAASGLTTFDETGTTFDDTTNTWDQA